MQRGFSMQEMKRNLKKVMIITAVMMLLLVCRLWYIQIAGHSELSAATVSQSLIALEGSNTRGIIYDRNGAALVADESRYIYIIKKDDFTAGAERLLDEAEAAEVDSGNEEYIVYSSESYDKEVGKQLIEENSAYIMQAAARYGDNQLAAHLIGYVNEEDDSGAAGLELMYDSRLSGSNRKVYAVADVNGNMILGRGLIITSDEENDSYIRKGIRTTLDKQMQQAVEDIIEEESNDCAVVVLDSGSGGVLAMACTPGFDPNDVDAYIDGGGDELINKVTQGEYAPGSVFKIVVAAAALENGISSERTYVCDGSVDVGGVTIGCDTGGETGHGEIGFEEAFAKSCNSFFIQLGQETGADSIVETAQKMKLGEAALEGYPQESAGHLMSDAERYGSAIGNLSIGQGETLVTPIQIARMTNIIASGGIDTGVHILTEDEADEEQVISSSTAEIIGNMMEAVTVYGTAQTLDLIDDDGSAKAAVKTGTAQYGESGSGNTNAWITGYTPCDNPEYVITVLVEDGESGSQSAGPIFRKIVEYLEESGSYSMPTLA